MIPSIGDLNAKLEKMQFENQSKITLMSLKSNSGRFSGNATQNMWILFMLSSILMEYMSFKDADVNVDSELLAMIFYLHKNLRNFGSIDTRGLLDLKVNIVILKMW